MQRMFSRWASSLLCFALLGCISPNAGGRNAESRQDNLRFPKPSVPIHIDAPEQQARYLVEHYWDAVDLRQPLSEGEEEELEHHIVDYIGLMQSFAQENYADQLLIPLKKASEEMLLRVLSIYKTYLYDAGSQIASDEYYNTVLQWCITSPKLSKELQEQARGLLERLRLNVVGEQAKDFVYTKVDGSKHRFVNETAPYTLLVFATAHCQTCHNTLQAISGNKQLQADVLRGDLGILVVYIQTSPQEYEGEQAELPEWISSGYDASGEILDKPLYDIKASPTIYIVSRSGKVVAKDLAPELLPSFSIKSINNNG